MQGKWLDKFLRWQAATLLIVCGSLQIIAHPTCAGTLTFTNPVITRGADPWVTQWKGKYYYSQSRRGAIYVKASEQLIDLGKGNGSRVWTPPSNKPYSKELWAPELHYLRGKWYIYVAADDGDNANHRMYVLEGTTQNPLDPFVFRGQLAAPTDRWAIDGTVLQMPDEKLYFIWSGWEGKENVAQNLYIAPMNDPLTISGERVCISRPEHDWEKHGNPLVNEGPQVLWRDGKLFIIYSASGSWGDNYCLGLVAWDGGDVLNASSWKKKPTPVFSSTPESISPGHCSFVKSRDGKEDWIVYHVAKYPGAGWNRQVHIQPFDWDKHGQPDFGKPIAAGVSVRVPGGERAKN